MDWKCERWPAVGSGRVGAGMLCKRRVAGSVEADLETGEERRGSWKWAIEGSISSLATILGVQYGSQLTGVRSRSDSASLADAAASTRSSHREPLDAAIGSAENAFRPSMLSLRAYSLDLPLSCFGLCWLLEMDDFRGLVALSRRWMGGRVDDRPGGDRDSIDGSSSRGLVGSNDGNASLWRWSCIEGSSTEVFNPDRRLKFLSDRVSCQRVSDRCSQVRSIAPPGVTDRIGFPIRVRLRMVQLSQCHSRRRRCWVYVFQILGRQRRFAITHPGVSIVSIGYQRSATASGKGEKRSKGRAPELLRDAVGCCGGGGGSSDGGVLIINRKLSSVAGSFAM